ncbi:MAG: zinc-ribbon domain-containing protein [Defluviitaleaceae bacterium]|nr:zinc-ribbon domain-containing protein [Defluviitaleaceae bacterium]
MKKKIQAFMRGRNGADELSKSMNFLAIVLLMLGIIGPRWIMYCAAAIIFLNYFRVLSKNLPARAKENSWYVKRVNNLQMRVKQRKTHRFFTCPKCKKTVRLPKGKGIIKITCTSCKNKFNGKT